MEGYFIAGAFCEFSYERYFELFHTSVTTVFYKAFACL